MIYNNIIKLLLWNDEEVDMFRYTILAIIIPSVFTYMYEMKDNNLQTVSSMSSVTHYWDNTY